jgi:hypothetical protein
MHETSRILMPSKRDYHSRSAKAKFAKRMVGSGKKPLATTCGINMVLLGMVIKVGFCPNGLPATQSEKGIG